MTNQLHLREWAIIGLVCGLIVACSSVSWFTRLHAKAHLEKWAEVKQNQTEIEVTIVGAVKTPGKHLFLPGTTLKEVLQKAGLEKRADRKKINFKKVIYTSEKIEIPEKPLKTRVKK